MVRHLTYAVLFAVSVYAGRLTAAPDTGVAMLWPAAGVGFVWYLTSMESEETAWGRETAVVTAAMWFVTTGINILSGMEPFTSFIFAVGNSAAGFFAGYLYRVLPRRSGVELDTLSDVPALLVAALGAGVGSALWGPVYSWLANGADPSLLWQAVARTGMGALLFGALMLRLLSQPPRVHPAGPRRIAGLAVLTAAVYWTTMVPFASEPLSFFLTCVTVVAAMVLTIDGILAFLVGAGGTILVASLIGFGPFALIGHEGEVFTAQAYVAAQTVIGLLLTLSREDMDALIRALRNARGRAERQSEMFGRVVASMSEAVVAVEGGHVILANESADRLFGLRKDMPVAGTVLATGEPDSTLPLDRALAGHSAVEDVLVDLDGQQRVVSVWAHPLGTEVGHAVAVARDVTQHRRQVSDLSSFASVLAHDLLNPIGAVQGWIEVIDDEAVEDTPPIVVTATERARQSAQRLKEIVVGLHSYSVARGGELSIGEVDLQPLAERLVAGRVAAAANDEAAVIPHCEVDACQTVLGDEALIAQVLDNLVGNAVKYSAPGTIPNITITASEPVGGFVTVRVDDNGIGIPEADRERVFEEFHRVDQHSTAYAGTGLGLSICRRMIERHGGTIRAVSAPGGGTRMEFTLPAAVADDRAEGDAPDIAQAAAAQGRVSRDAMRRLGSNSGAS